MEGSINCLASVTGAEKIIQLEKYLFQIHKWIKIIFTLEVPILIYH